MNVKSCLCALTIAGFVSSLAIADARVRVVHASPDAPAVDVLVNDGIAFGDLAFTGITSYASLPADTYNVKVTPAGAPRTVVIEADLTLDADTDYTVVAVGELADIAPLVLVDDNTIDVDNARIRFVHASPNAPAVDIALADGGPVLFGNVSFTEVGDSISVPGGSYDLEVRLAGTDTVVLPLPGIGVDNGTNYTVFAMGLVGAEPPLQAVIGVDNALSRVRAIHASPDAPAVDIFVNGGLAIADLAFTGNSGYVGLAPDTYNVQVTPTGLLAPVVIDADLDLEAGVDYTVAAVGLLDEIAPLVLVDDNTLDDTVARIRFVHASPDAPAVDIALAGGAVLFGDVSFTEVGDYISVPGGSYDLEVRLAGTETVVLPLPNIAVSVNTVYSVFATGLVGGMPALGATIFIDAQGPSPAGPADLNGDGVVDSNDLGLLLRDWGSTDSAADLNGDGVVDGADLGILLSSWTF